ncbi:MAG: phage adaptor protein [Gammaproteobacteria bacterium]
MSMARADLKTDLQAILGDSAQKFAADPNAFDRHLDMAALALARKTRRTLSVKLTLQADVDSYAAPADLIDVKFSSWGGNVRTNRKPWEFSPGTLPRPSVYEDAGIVKILLTPAPSAYQIANLGADYPLFYYSNYTIGATDPETNIPEKFRDLLLIRATVQALMELANMGIAKPVSLGNGGVGSMPKNGMPSALAASWLTIFEGEQR